MDDFVTFVLLKVWFKIHYSHVQMQNYLKMPLQIKLWSSLYFVIETADPEGHFTYDTACPALRSKNTFISIACTTKGYLPAYTL